MAFHFPLASVVRRRGCLEEVAALERFEELQRRDHAHDEQRGAATRRPGDETASAGRRWRMAQTATKGAR